MDCLQFQQRIDAVVDGQAADAEGAEFAQHAQGCAACREQLAGARELAGDLRQALAGERALAEGFAARMEQRFLMREPNITDLPAQSAAPSVPRAEAPSSDAARPLTLEKFSSWLATLAAGFLLAVLTFQPWQAPVAEKTGQQGTGQQGTSKPGDEHPAPDLAVARLVVATGEVAIRPADGAAWSAASPVKQFGCAAGASVKTEPGVRCELQTTEGCVVRLNDASEVIFRSPRSLELKQGQVWCSAPAGVAMEVATVPAADAKLPPGCAWVFQCPHEGSLISTLNPAGEVRLTAARGAIDVQCGPARRRVASGETVTLAGDGFAPEPQHEDALLAAAWIDALLVKKGPTNPELLARVDKLLAQIGRAKSSYLYEQELRGLGEHCVLPLLRYVQAPVAGDDPEQRRMAMRIVSDLAPSWAVGDLIPLLADADDEVRFTAAAALRRLTGHDQGRPPKDWRSPWADCTPTYAAWQTWWQANRARYPAPEFAKDLPLPSPKGYKKS